MGSTITPPLRVLCQVSRENQTCLCCDKTVAQLQELKRPIHYGFGKCDIYDQMKKKGYPLKEITFINRAGLETKLEVFDDGTERGQQIPDMRVMSQPSEGAVLFKLMHILFNPLEFEGNNAKFLEVKSGSYRPVKEVMKLVSGSNISYAEADCAWLSLLQEVENLEDCFFTCQQIAEEVSYLRPDAKIPQAPFQNVIPTPVPVPHS
ncbi:hypothetical protein HDU79_000491, partial [Rhizoclosmatium sp. JEL0117]